MKVLIFNHSFFNISETFIYKQVTGQPSDVVFSLMGFNIINEDIFPLKAEKIKLDKQVNFIDKLLTTALWKIFKIRPGFSVFNHFKVKNYLKRNRPDLVHVHFGFNALLIYPIAKSLNIPMVVTFHGVDASPQYLKDKK
jgi:colanic acid/amylovoran biosynthesis glycosyltransferase